MISEKRITFVDIVAAVIGVLLVVSLTQGGSAATRVAKIESPSRITLLGAEPRSGDAVAAYGQWRRTTSHHGAFATTPSGGFGWVSEYNDPEFAQTAALAYCRAANNDPCVIIAVSGPLSPSAEGETALSNKTLRHYQANQDRGGFRAFAVSPNGASGWAWNHTTPFTAWAAALRSCERQAKTQEEFLPPAPCELIR